MNRKFLRFSFCSFFTLFLIFPFVTNVFAQENNAQIAQKYGITFPIPELGNCNNIQTCRVYCDQRENHASCTAFAKSKGFYKEAVSEQKVNALSAAKAELGCNSVESCKTLCQQKTNQALCQSFAQKHKLITPQEASAKDEELLVQAKQNLSCDSPESCKALCDKQENYVKCAALLQDQVTSDDRAMFEKYKPQIKEFLGCDSIVTCMAFCINPLNSAKCAELGSKIGGSEQIPNQEPPEVWCPKISSECKWDGTNCVCNGPQTCTQSNDIPGCTWDGAQCNCPGIYQESPEVWCPKAGPGCSWDGKECFCPGTESSAQTAFTQPTQEPGEVWCPKIGPYCVWDGSSCTCWDDCVKAGGIWTGSKCNPPQEQTTTQTPDQINATPEPGEVWCPRNSDCKWTGEVCQCVPQLAPQTVEQSPAPVVQGTKTNRGLLQQILDFFLGR